MNYQVAVVRNLDITLIAVSLIILILRLYSRIFIIQKPGLDDALAFAGLCFAVAQCVLEISREYFTKLDLTDAYSR